MIFQKSWKRTKRAMAVILAITLFVSGWGNYDDSVLAADELTVTLSEESAIYTGDEIHLPEIEEISGNVVHYLATWTDEEHLEITGDRVTEAGIYTLNVEETEEDGNGQFIGNGKTGRATFTIEPKSLSEEMVNVSVTPAVSNGESQKIDVTVKDGDRLVNAEEYRVTYRHVENGVESEVPSITLAGTYKVIVEAKENSNYKGTVSKEIKVTYGEAPADPLTYEGNTFRKGIYAGEVVVRPTAGYYISASEAGTFSDKITYTESQPEGKIYLQSISNHLISEAVRKALFVDRTAPVNLLAVCEDKDTWKQRKNISVSVTEEETGCTLYYAESDVLTDCCVINSLPAGLEEIAAVKDGDSYTGSFAITETISSTEKTYYVYAIDDAGNVAKTSVDVSRIETENPVIHADETIDNFEDGVYWINGSVLEIPISVNDFDEMSSGAPGSEFVSGIQSVEVRPDEGAEFEGAYEVGNQEVSGILKVAEPGDYTIKVTDQAGNETFKTFTVKQDTVAPEITLGTPEGLDRYYNTDTDIYWFSDGNITIPVTIIDTAGDSENEKASYDVIYATSRDMSDSKTLEIISDEGMAELTLDQEGTAVIYYFQVKDRAGNEGTVRDITLAYDETEPNITVAGLPQLNGDEWINQEEFHGESRVEFSVTATDQTSDTKECSGIGKIEYSSDYGEHYKEAAYFEENGVYTFTSVDAYEDGADYQWAVRISDNVGNTGNWVPVSGGKIDTTAPGTTAYIKFFSDTEGANDTDRGDASDGKWISHIFEIATSAWNKIWGKRTIKFEVYVQDVTSGINTISMSYVSQELSDSPIVSGSPTFSLTKVEGLKAFSEGDPDAREAVNNASGYTVFEGEITCTAEELAARNFRIDSLTDIAGNTTTEKITLGNAENTDIIYLDAVAPVLSVAVCDDNSANSNLDTDILTKEKYFYHNSKKMVLTIDERFFEQENTPVYPTVTLLSRENVSESFSKENTTSVWRPVSGTNQWQAEMSLPLVDDKEMEYQITMSAYADPSGNVLVGDTTANHAVSAGVFTSKIYVVDARSPKLVDYHVSDSTVCRNQGIPIYKNNLEENDLTVTFVIDDQEEYYRQSKDHLSVKVYRNQEELPVLSLTEEELQKEFDGRNHRYSFGYDGIEDTEDAYYVEISFRDEVGNLLIDGRSEAVEGVEAAEGIGNPGTLKNGTYISEKYIIDHVAPEFHIEFSDAENVVKNGVSDAGKKPLSGHTSYYHEDIRVQLTFRDHFANENFDGSLEHFGLKLYKDGASVPLAGGDLVNVISNVKWIHDRNVHTAEFSMKADPEGHTTDGNYQFVVTYRDCAGNTMIPSKDGQGNYTSPVLVIDTTAPVVKTSYSEEVTRTAAGIDYFNDTNGTFDIKVADRNIRYEELKKELQNFRTYDIDGTEIIGSALAEAVEAIEETGMECSYGNEPAKQWLLKLPLQTEANYEIPVDFMDLAGNPAVVNKEAAAYLEKVTVDKTPVNENIYIQFSSDVQGANDITVTGQQETWVSRLLLFISEHWNKLWGRETIRFKIYVRDETSGIESLCMSYFEDQKAVGLSSETGTLKRENGTATLEDGCNYVVFTGKITRKDAEDLFITQFQIDEVVDKSGNTRENIWFAGTKINEQIYLDDQPPVLLNVTVDQMPIEIENRYYYHESKQVVLTMEERFMGQEMIPVYPKVVVSSRRTGGTNLTEEFTENPDIVVGKWNPIGDEKWQAVVELIAETDEEMEYLITIDGYQDGAGHALTGINVTDGSFTSKTIVIDRLAPELKEFTVTANGEVPLVKEEGLYFAKNIQGDDVKITVTVDDNETYFHPEAVEISYDIDDSGVWVKLDGSNVSWENGGAKNRLHTAVYTFDGAKDEEHTYQFKITYSDRAGNPMVNHGADAFGILAEQGSFVSGQKVVIDHLAPKLTKLVFDTPVQIFDRETNDVNGTLSVENKVTDRNSRVYYDSNAKICFDMDDAYLKAADLKVNIYQRDDKLETFHDTNDAVPKQSYLGTEIAKNQAFEFTMPAEDAEYYFTISYTDRAGNQMMYAPKIETENNAAYAGGIRSNTDTYVSPVIIQDTVTPVCEVTYTTDKVASDLSDYYYSVNAVEAVVHVNEMNLDMEASKIYVTAEDINGNRISCPEVEKYNGISSVKGKSWAEVAADSQQTTEAKRGSDGKLTSRSMKLKFETEARYTVRIEVVDKVKKDTVQEKIFCIDRTVPVITIVDTNGHHLNEVVKAGLLDEATSDITYRVVNDGTFAHIINKLTFGYFAKEKIRVQIRVHDQISGIDRIVYNYTDVKKDEANGIAYQPGKATTSDMETFRMDANDRGCAIYQFDLPISFKGTIKAYGIDKAGNSAENTSAGAIGVIAETSDKHSKNSKTTLEVLSNSPKTKDYYNEDVKIRFTSQDGYSGLYLIDYLAGNDLQETVSYGVSGEEIVTSEIIRDYLIRASSNNDNNIKLGLRLEDHAGHETKVSEEQLPKIHIDTTKPVVEVEYDNLDVLNEKYYKDDRIATVTVTERNFDPEDVTFELEGPEVSISEWSHVAGAGCAAGNDPSDTEHTDSCSWVCQVHFSEDGDYVFGFRCVDLAGNEGVYEQVDEFVIDKTIPKITVEYDNNSFLNEYYYKEARTATITIEEHNFSANDVELTMTAKDDGNVTKNPGISGWAEAGDFHTATIRYDYDGEFTFDIAYKDLAGNEAEDYEPEHFIVDLTAPELEIFDIEDRSANNGEVRPGIRYFDTNYDPEGTVILMTGYHTGTVEMVGEKKLQENGMELKLHDFAYEPKTDDLYIMEATVYDFAGNSSEATVQFSVNRFGSVYTFDEATDALIGDRGRYYTNREQELVITETNVDTLEFQEITCNLNGKLTTLKEGQDYSVSLNGNDSTWKQYTYTIGAHNFTEEGTYILTIYSEDRATNASDNNSKGKKVEFVVDKTKPSIVISGVENNGQYRTNSREMTLNVEDNVKLLRVAVSIDGKETVLDAAKIYEADGTFAMEIGSTNHWQDIQVTVTDAAGNEETSENLRVLVTANMLVQFYRNTKLFYGSLGIIVLGAGLIFARKRRRQ